MTLAALIKATTVALVSWSHQVKVQRHKRRFFVDDVSRRLYKFMTLLFDVRRSRTGRTWIQWKRK